MTTATGPASGISFSRCHRDSFYCTFAAMRAKLRRLHPVKALTVPFATIRAGMTSKSRARHHIVLGRAAPRPGCCTPIPCLLLGTRTTLKRKILKQRGAKGAGDLDDMRWSAEMMKLGAAL